jgi:hypothetical protein
VARDDWFRRTTWTSQDETDFYARLGRSRSPFHKSQYLRLQAGTLLGTGRKPLVLAALRLLDRLFAECPDQSQLESAHLQAAMCYDILGNLEKAIVHFRLAIAAHSGLPNYHSGVSLEFPWFIVQHGLSDHFNEALVVLQSAHIAFPVEMFKAATIRCRIAQAQGDSVLAVQSAREALRAASSTASQFQNHRSLGLVGEKYAPILKELHAVAAT